MLVSPFTTANAQGFTAATAPAGVRASHPTQSNPFFRTALKADTFQHSSQFAGKTQTADVQPEDVKNVRNLLDGTAEVQAGLKQWFPSFNNNDGANAALLASPMKAAAEAFAGAGILALALGGARSMKAILGTAAISSASAAVGGASRNSSNNAILDLTARQILA